MMKIKHSVNVLPCMALNLIRTAEVAPAEMRDTTRVTMRLETFFMIAIEVDRLRSTKKNLPMSHGRSGLVFSVMSKAALLSVQCEKRQF